MQKAIIFDFDGVIGDTFQINLELFREFIDDFSVQDFKDNHNGNIFQGSKMVLDPKQWKKYFLEISKLQWELSCKEK